MNPKPTAEILDDPLADVQEQDQPSDAEMARSLRVLSHAMMRRKALESEKALKGLQCDWIFNKLNLTKYR